MAMAGLADLDEFARAAVTRRQLAAFETECDCTRKLHAKYARQHAELSAALVLDGSGFRWEGLGNSGTRWMGLLRFGHATGRATFLKVTKTKRVRNNTHDRRVRNETRILTAVLLVCHTIPILHSRSCTTRCH